MREGLATDPTAGRPGREIQRLRVMFRSRGKRELPSVERVRSDFEAFSRLFEPPVEVACLRGELGGVAVEWLEPQLMSDGIDKLGPRGPVIYLHGGGYVSGSLETHRELTARLAGACGRQVINVDYRLAPEFPFPAALEDARAVYLALIEQRPAHEVSLAGDSAGGGLALSLLVDLRQRGVPLPAAAALLSPWSDLTLSGSSVTERAAADPVITHEGLVAMSQLYLDGTDPRHPLASPLYAPLDGLPSILLQAGTDEILLDDSTRLAERLRLAGNQVELEVWTGMIHVWHYYAALLPEGQQAIERCAAFLNRHHCI